MRIHKKIVCLFLLFQIVSCFSQYNWEQTAGIASANPYGILVEDEANNYYFCNFAGPFYSSDLGKNWTWCEGGYKKIVKYLLVDESDNLYYFHDSVYVSNDKGVTFKSYNNFNSHISYSVSRFSFPSYFKDTIACLSSYYLNDSGFFAINYSIDGGRSFKKTITSSSINMIKKISNLIRDSKGNYYFNYGSDGAYMINSISSTDKKLIYKFPFEYSDGSEILRIMHDTILIYQFGQVPNYTTNFGKTWYTFANQPAYFINCATNSDTYLGIDEQDVWKTTNFGETWELIYNYGGYLTAPPAPLISENGICFLSFGYNDSGRDLLRGEQIAGIIRNEKDEFLFRLINNANTIEFKESADFQLYDISGSLLINEKESKAIGISKIADGTYLYFLVINKKEYKGKLMINRL